MKLFLLTMIDSLRSVPQKVEMWGAEDTPLEHVLNKAQEFTNRFIESDRVSKPLKVQRECDRIYYSPIGNPDETPSNMAYVQFSINPNAVFNAMDRNAIKEYI